MTRLTLRPVAPTALVVIGVLMLGAALVMWWLSSGSAVALRTGSGLCYLSMTAGELVVDADAGVAIIEKSMGDPDRTMPLAWPPGYTARRAGSEVEVIDGRGVVVARTGTRMEIRGGYGEGGFVVCDQTRLDGNPEMTLLP